MFAREQLARQPAVIRRHRVVASGVAAWVAIVYVFALVALNGALLFSARRAILKEQPTRLSTAIAFLYKEYKPWAYWSAGRLQLTSCQLASRALTDLV